MPVFGRRVSRAGFVAFITTNAAAGMLAVFPGLNQFDLARSMAVKATRRLITGYNRRSVVDRHDFRWGWFRVRSSLGMKKTGNREQTSQNGRGKAASGNLPTIFVLFLLFQTIPPS